MSYASSARAPAIGHHGRLNAPELLRERLRCADRPSDGRLIANEQDPRRVLPDAESGRGLFIVDACSNAWGCRPGKDGTGKVIWAALGPKSAD
ncbi:ATP-binding protein [Actinoallomurus sp. NPDC052308]|uniref:ATP-binding protein n=1 Tax=Actinoallomurus sp. NPDC052308 TaxID=3155530 RepID=UPI003419687C